MTAKDASNATITNYSGTIHFTSSDGAATLPANYTFVPGDAGAHTFTNGVVLKTAGSQTVSVNDVAQPTTTGSATVNVTGGRARPLRRHRAGNGDRGHGVHDGDGRGQGRLRQCRRPAGPTPFKCVTFSGPADAPDGTTPSYPALHCPAGQSLLFFNGSGVGRPVLSSITLFDAQTTALTVSSGTSTGTSANITVGADTAAGLTFTNASNRNGPVTVTCTGAIATLTCTPASMNGSGNGRFFMANVGLVDAYQNTAQNSSGGTITVTLARTGGSSLAPATVTIPNGQTTSTATFKLSLSNGSSSATVTASATVSSAAVTAQLTTT